MELLLKNMSIHIYWHIFFISGSYALRDRPTVFHICKYAQYTVVILCLLTVCPVPFYYIKI